MFIPLKMVLIGIDPYPYTTTKKKTSHNSQRWLLFGPAADRLTKPAGRSCCSCQHCLTGEGWQRLAPGRGIWRQYQLIIIQLVNGACNYL